MTRLVLVPVLEAELTEDDQAGEEEPVLEVELTEEPTEDGQAGEEEPVLEAKLMQQLISRPRRRNLWN